MGRKPTWPPPVYPNWHTGQERMRVHVHGKPKDIVLGPIGSEQAKARYRQLVADMERNGRVYVPPAKPAEPLTVDDVIGRFWLHAEAEYDQAGREPENFRRSLAPVVSLYGPTPARTFGPKCLKALQQAMASGSWMTDEERKSYEKRRRPIGWCRNVVNRRITRVKTVWKWAESEELVPAGSYHQLCTVRGLKKNAQGVRHTKKRQPAEWEEVKSVLRYCPPPVAVMLELQHWTGMRDCEVLIMRTCDIDRSGDDWLYRPASDKNDWREDAEPRVVSLGPQAEAVVADWLRENDPTAYLFQARPGKPYSTISFDQAVRRACRKAGVKFTPYQLRHEAKQRITRQYGLDGARAVLGQKSLGTTNQYGSAIDVKKASEIAREAG